MDAHECEEYPASRVVLPLHQLARFRYLPRPLHALQEKPVGPTTEAWQRMVQEAGFNTVDVGEGLASAMAPKDEEESKNIKKAAFLVSSAVQSFAVPQIEGEDMEWRGRRRMRDEQRCRRL